MRLTRFERFDEPVASRSEFLRRMFVRLVAALLLIAITIIVGAVLYNWFFPAKFKGTSSFEAIHSAAMVVSGLDTPVDKSDEIEEKLFVDFYALLSSIVTAVALGLALAPPVFHRVLHHSHAQDKQATSAAARYKPANRPDADA